MFFLKLKEKNYILHLIAFQLSLCVQIVWIIFSKLKTSFFHKFLEVGLAISSRGREEKAKLPSWEARSILGFVPC